MPNRDIDLTCSIADRIRAAEEALPVPYSDYREIADERDALKARVAELEEMLADYKEER